MNQSYRRSLQLGKRSSQRMEVKAERIGSNISRQQSNRSNVRVSLRNIKNVFASDTDLQPKKIPLKNARNQTICFFRAGEKQEVVALSLTVDCKIAKPTGGTFKTFKKATRQNATVSIGDGRLFIEMKGDQLYFELNHVENMNLANDKAKEVWISFKGDDQVFFLKCQTAEQAQSIVREIYLEVRRLCFALNKIVENILPEDFRRKQDLKAFHALPLDEKTTTELCLRELVDLTLFSRGPADSYFVDVADMFSFFLKTVGASEEANYWGVISSHAKQSLEAKLNNTADVGKRPFLQEIRSPKEIKDQSEMKSASTPSNADSLMQRMQLGINQSAKALRKKQQFY